MSSLSIFNNLVSSSPRGTLPRTTGSPRPSRMARRGSHTRVARCAGSSARLTLLSAHVPSLQAEEIRAKFGYEERGPRGVDLIIDCTGAEICVQTALFLAKHGGTYVQVSERSRSLCLGRRLICSLPFQVGMGNDNITIPITTVLNKELSIKGSFRYGPGCYQTSIDLVARGAIDLGPLITHRYVSTVSILSWWELPANHSP